MQGVRLMSSFRVNFTAKNTIADQIRDVLSTPRGSVPRYPDYGLNYSIIDTDIGGAVDLYEFKDSVKHQIINYVSRIEASKANVQIKYNRLTGELFVQIDNILVNLTQSSKLKKLTDTGPET